MKKYKSAILTYLDAAHAISEKLENKKTAVLRTKKKLFLIMLVMTRFNKFNRHT